MYRVSALCLAIAVVCWSPGAGAQQCGGSNPDMLVVLDRSGSMTGTKWTQAKAAVSNVVATYQSKIRFGLMLFPFPSSCGTSPPQVGCSANNYSMVTNTLNSYNPTGMTPMGSALQQARSYLVSVDPGKAKYVLLITDGCETCSGNPLGEVTSLFGSSIKTFVVGFGSGTSVCASTLSSMASAGGTGTVYQAVNQAQLNSALQSIVKSINCCGNGKLDGGETCDVAIAMGSPGGCPVHCDDKNACTTDLLTGSQCTAKCSHTQITMAKHGDGCCPPGANSKTDSDCQAVCGNGLLEGGEACDPAIPAGKGKCPTQASCDDNKACTQDLLIGSNCQVHCLNNPITVAKNGDGCCPPGANSKLDSDCQPVCGNGLLEGSEVCDPAIPAGTGKCPTLADCDDKKVCTKDVLVGGKCQLGCVNTLITVAKSGDGCCPAGANSKTDSDCKPVCGNGLLESGEACDTAIAVGTGACPSLADCDDKKVCTVDTLGGAACLQKCVNTPITAANSGDGCCPAGANSKTDSDCKPVCGNGVREVGETCDTAITSGPGKCPTQTDCDDKDKCTADALAGSACTAKCAHTKLVASLTQKDGCCPSTATSLSDADCPPVCGNGVVESGEKCDMGITSGKGKCPSLSDCDDKDTCTSDSLVGSGCNSQCKNKKLAANMTKKDGCCPTGENALTDADCPPVCGNGVVEGSETCDTAIKTGAGKCPVLADCDDSDVCTADSLDGSLCTATCKNKPLTADPLKKDGCCPTGATYLTDADCSPSCGNGKLDSGELCDPKISSGKGKCPVLADCDDNDTCTADSLSGGACTLKCVSTKLKPDHKTKDGCCPAGANALTDADCTSKCGNGVLEPGEACDTGITSGKGKCKTLSECDDSDKCTVDTLIGSGCSSKCVNTKLQPDAKQKDGCCPQGHSLTTDADCPPPCGPDTTKNCVNLCKDVKCPAGHHCKQGKCVPGGQDGGVATGDGGATTGDGASPGPGVEAGGSTPAGDGSGTGSNDSAPDRFTAVEGCACQASGRLGSAPVVLLLGLLLLFSRRRRT